MKKKKKREKSTDYEIVKKFANSMPAVENTFNQENEDFTNEKAPRLMK